MTTKQHQVSKRALQSVADELRREARLNSLCGSEEWTELLNRAADQIEGAVDALKATLLFHSGSPWDFDKAQEWDRITRTLLPEPERHEHNWRDNGLSVKFDATTRTLCDVARAALAGTKARTPIV